VGKSPTALPRPAGVRSAWSRFYTISQGQPLGTELAAYQTATPSKSHQRDSCRWLLCIFIADVSARRLFILIRLLARALAHYFGNFLWHGLYRARQRLFGGPGLGAGLAWDLRRCSLSGLGPHSYARTRMAMFIARVYSQAEGQVDQSPYIVMLSLGPAPIVTLLVHHSSLAREIAFEPLSGQQPGSVSNRLH